MIDTITPPTDNLYKFIAIGGLAFALVVCFYLFREQSRLRGQYIDAQVELYTAGYEEGTGVPEDLAMRRLYMRRQWTEAEAKSLLKLAGGLAGYTMGVSLTISFVAFGFWWFRVQKYDDAILRMTAAKLQQEVAAGGTKS